MPIQAFVACTIISLLLQSGAFIGCAHLAHKDKDGGLAVPIILLFIFGIALNALNYQLLKVLIG